MRPSEVLKIHANEIRSVVIENGAKNPRVFGSVLHGTDTSESDLDILVDPIEGCTTLFGLARIKRLLEDSLGISVDVMTPMSLKENFRDSVLNEARPL